MSRADESKIITTALEHPGLLTTKELQFVVSMSRLPSQAKLSADQTKWLYDIGRNRLNMVLADPHPEPFVDYRARAYL